MGRSDRVFRSFAVGFIGIAIIAIASLIVRNDAMVFELPLTEDGYYVQTVARNIARGIWFSVDGITHTNGFHPLWAVLSSLAFLIAGDSTELAIRILLAASVITTITSAFLWASLSSGAFDANP